MQYPTRKILNNNATLNDTLYELNKIAIAGAKNKLVIDYANNISGSNEIELLENIYKKVYNDIFYYPDLTNDQNIRTPNKVLRDLKANCIDYTGLISSILIIKKIDHYYKVVASSNNKNLDHIYIITKSGLILDPVIGQPQNGTSNQYNREPAINFNREINNFDTFTYKVKNNMRLYKVNGFDPLTDITEQGQPDITNEYARQNIFEISITARPGIGIIARPGAYINTGVTDRPGALFTPWGPNNTVSLFDRAGAIKNKASKNLILPVAIAGALFLFN